MKNSKYLQIFALSLLWSAHLANAQIGIDVEMRPRMEYRNGYKYLSTIGVNPAFFISQRTRLGLGYQRAKLQGRIAVQDVRVWGDESRFGSTSVTGDDASIDLQEAWLRFQLSTQFWLKLGRQIFQYDDQRLLSPRNWNQHGVAYDAILLGYQERAFQLDAGFSLNNAGENIMGQAYPRGKLKTLTFVFLQGQVASCLKANLLLMGTGFTSGDTTEIIYIRGSYGAGVSYVSACHEIDLRTYFQNGKNADGQSVQAYCFSLDAMQKWAALRATAGIHYLSGQDQWNFDAAYQDKDHLFDIFYGARHRYYGAMDYFSNIPRSTAGGGLVDMFLRGEYQSRSGHQYRVDFHHFALGADVAVWKESTGSYQKPGRGLGSELDISVKVPIAQILTLQGGYSVMFPETTLQQLQDVAGEVKLLQHWAWLMLTWKEDWLKN